MDDFDSTDFSESLSTEEVILCKNSFSAVVTGTSDTPPVLELGSCSWQPDLITEDGSPVHIQRTLRLPRYAKRRIIASTEASVSPILAIPRVFLNVPDLIRFVTSYDILVTVVDENWNCTAPSNALDVVSSEVSLSAGLRIEVGKNALELCLSAETSHLKGKRLESLLSFLLSQVDDLEIHSTNLKTESEELDVVVRTRGVGKRSWQLQGASFIIVEAKNWSAKVGQSVVSTFLVKLMRKRNTCRIGMIVGIGGFTSEAELQELSFSGNGDITICLVDLEKLEDWINSEKFDDYFEEMIEAAMLR